MNKKYYKFISIEQIEIGGELEVFEQKPVYRIFNKKEGTQLGVISWYRPWKKYVFRSKENFVFDKVCLENVVDFITDL